LEKDFLLTIKNNEGQLDWSQLANGLPLKQIIEGKIDGMGRREEDVSSY